MVLEDMLGNTLQIRGVSALEVLLRTVYLTPMVKQYLVACKVEGKTRATLQGYCDILVSFLKFIKNSGDVDAKHPVSTSNVRYYLLSLMERKLSPASIHCHYRALRTFFNWLKNEKCIKASPMLTIKPPKLPKKLIHPFTVDDVCKILSLGAGSRFLELRNRAIILVFLDTGLRLHELANMQIADYNHRTDTIHVMGKGAKERIVHIGEGAQKALLQYLVSRDDEHPCVWVTEERRPMSKKAIQTLVYRSCGRAGITGAKHGPHSFRHTFGTMSLRNGASLLDVQNIMGHSTSDTTRLYLATIGSEDAALKHKSFSPVDRLKL